MLQPRLRELAVAMRKLDAPLSLSREKQAQAVLRAAISLSLLRSKLRG